MVTTHWPGLGGVGRGQRRGGPVAPRNTTPSLTSHARGEMLPRAMVVEGALGSVATAFRRVEVLKRPIWRAAGFLAEAAGPARRAPRSPEPSHQGRPAPECVRLRYEVCTFST